MTSAIPQPPGVPLLGNIFDISPANTWVSLQKLWEKYGEIFKITVLGQQIVFIGSASLCQEICDETRFRKYVGGPIVEIRHAVHDALFTAFDHESSWGVHHRIMAPLLTQGAVPDYFGEVRDCAAELVAKWRQGAQVEPISELNRLDLETTTLCFYGRRLNGLSGPENPMIKAMNDSTSEAMKRPTRPRLINWLFFQSRFHRASAAMRSYAADCVAYRKSHPTDRRDLLYAMMHGTDSETGRGLSESQIIDEIVTLPIGSSTAPCVIASAIYYLLQNPGCIATARAEIDRVLGDEGAFTHEHIDQLPYCQGIIRETLRLSAAAPGFNIEPVPGTVGPVSLAGGKYTVPANQTLIVVLHGVNRDPSVFGADAAQFRPERMTGTAFEKLPEGVKKWFGNGKRVCIGRHWAWMWNVVVLVSLLRGVDFEMVDEAYRLRQDGWFNLRPVGFEVVVKPRVK